MKRRVNGQSERLAKEIEALDLVTVEFCGKEVHGWGRNAIGSCDPSVRQEQLIMFGDSLPPDVHVSPAGAGMSMTLQDVAGHAVRLTDVVQRQYIWLGLMREMLRHTSKVIFFRRLSILHPQWRYCHALQIHTSYFILSNANQHNEVQPKQIRTVKVPESFAEYRVKGDSLAA
jgi:actin-related protein 9